MYQRVFQHMEMLADRVRMAAYQEAIHQIVMPGAIVADIGTGSGVLAFFAVQAGASKVYAIEHDDIIDDAQRLAKINGMDGKSVFIKERSERVELPEKVDVIISELIGYFGLEENFLNFKIDARERFLKPCGRLVPSWMDLYAVPVETEAIWEEYIGLWGQDFYGLDFSPVRQYACSERFVADCSQARQLAPPALLFHIDIETIEKIPRVFHGRFVTDKKGILHGLLGYFVAGLSPTVVLSTAPGNPLTHWRHAFFPLGDKVMVEEGDEVQCTIKAIPQGITTCWQWDTRVVRKGEQRARFSQSNLRIAKEDVIIGKTGFRPVLQEKGMIRRRILDLCDGNRSLEEISEVIRAEYPASYQSSKAARRDVVDTVRWLVIIQ
ncbi:MAG: 50S ribosomal protein L11 methyltransferase [Deltaproteobacteria bacterium]|nr:50S ribosomal protein L11 methyltransferase [Deltaproteobacteria bacterium]